MKHPLFSKNLPDKPFLDANGEPIQIEEIPFLSVHKKKGSGNIIIVNVGAYDYQSYGLIVTDIVRQIANSFDINEELVWEWVEKERHNPTTLVDPVE